MAEESAERPARPGPDEPPVRDAEAAGERPASDPAEAADAATDRSASGPADATAGDRPLVTDGGSDVDDTKSDADAEADTETDAESDADADVTDADAETDADTDAAGTTDADAESRRTEADGEGYVGDRPVGGNVDAPSTDEDVGGISAPPDDEEMPLADHIEEMILRLSVVLLFGAAGTAVGILWASQAIEFIWLNIFPSGGGEEIAPHLYSPLELWMTRIKVAALLGIMVALPMFVYQCYLFMRPGLYPHERKYYLAAVPTSVILAGIGMLFSYLLVLPILFEYFTYYAEGSAAIQYALGETFNLIITLTGFLAIVFQIPLFIMLAIMMGVTTRRWLASKRLYFWAAFFGIAFMFTIDPTGMAPVLVTLTMVVLFEGTLLVLKWVGAE